MQRLSVPVRARQVQGLKALSESESRACPQALESGHHASSSLPCGRFHDGGIGRGRSIAC